MDANEVWNLLRDTFFGPAKGGAILGAFVAACLIVAYVLRQLILLSIFSLFRRPAWMANKMLVRESVTILERKVQRLNEELKQARERAAKFAKQAERSSDFGWKIDLISSLGGEKVQMLDKLMLQLRECQEQGKLAIRQRDDARAELEAFKTRSAQAPADMSSKFKAAKTAFARLYHPDNIRTDGIDKMVRAEIFKEFWKELEAIEARF